MSRLVRILLIALLLGPQVAEILPPPAAACGETRGCCGPDGACDASCVACPCCANPAPGVTSAIPAGAPGGPAGPAGTTQGAAALPLLPTDILHVPRSL